MEILILQYIYLLFFIRISLTSQEIRNVLCISLSMIITVIVLHPSTSSMFGHASGTVTTYVPKIKSIDIQKNLQKEIANETNFKTINNSNERFTFIVDKKRSDGSEMPLTLEDPKKSCISNFKCVISVTTGWNDNSSLELSTVNNTRDQWSSIIGQEVRVKANDRYELLSHIKLNNLAKQSNIRLEGFNETSKTWYEILRCPYDLNGPLDWKEFRCSLTVDQNVSKIRPVFNAGWSSKQNREALTWFDYINMTKFKSFIADPNLKSEVVYQGLDEPTSMAFLGPNDFLVLEKDKGTVQRIINGVKLSKPLIDLDVAKDEGLLGIAVNKTNKMGEPDSNGKSTYVYLYFTSQNTQDEQGPEHQGKKANLVYRYELVDNMLKNGKLLLDLPAGYQHNGGPILIGPDKKSVYLSIGDLENETYRVIPHKALNNKTGLQPDGSGGILRFTQNGEPINGGILGNKYPLNLYYAYGIRESFGMDFDPVTGKLWDTENGQDAGDEINMLEPGFNGGWNKVQGIWPYVEDYIPNANDTMHNPPDLVTFDGKGRYYTPQFTWNQTVGPTAVTFLPTDKLGKQYKNDMLVADVNNGRIYHFKLNQSRTGLLLQGPLQDKVADNDQELQKIIFAGDFGLITDMDVGPDGYLYFVIFNEGKIYRIVPVTLNDDTTHLN
jgi:aldose sugar dehydrogenase